jgi:hypothetical protein
MALGTLLGWSDLPPSSWPSCAGRLRSGPVLQVRMADGADAPRAQTTVMEVAVAYIGFLGALCWALGFIVRTSQRR